MKLFQRKDLATTSINETLPTKGRSHHRRKSFIYACGCQVLSQEEFHLCFSGCLVLSQEEFHLCLWLLGPFVGRGFIYACGCQVLSQEEFHLCFSGCLVLSQEEFHLCLWLLDPFVGRVSFMLVVARSFRRKTFIYACGTFIWFC